MQHLARTSAQPLTIATLTGLLQQSTSHAASVSRSRMHTAPGEADWAICSITASSERASTVCVQGSHSITIDHPTYLGGHDSAPGPVAHFLGSLVGAQQASLHAGDNLCGWHGAWLCTSPLPASCSDTVMRTRRHNQSAGQQHAQLDACSRGGAADPAWQGHLAGAGQDRRPRRAGRHWCTCRV